MTFKEHQLFTIYLSKVDNIRPLDLRARADKNRGSRFVAEQGIYQDSGFIEPKHMEVYERV